MKNVRLKEEAIFLQISIQRMGDKRGVSSDEIEVDADKDLVKVRKVIFKSAAFDRIKSLDAEIRRYVRSVCFPYEDGFHLVAPLMVPIINENLRSYNQRRFELVSTFGETIPTLKMEFPEKLRKLYNEKDYDIQDIYSRFSMSWQFLKLEVPPTVEQLSSAMYKEEKKKLESRMDEAYEEARMILRETCLSLITHLREALAPDQYGGQKRLTSSTVTKLQEFLNMFDLRNITNDTELSRYINQAKEIVNPVNAESLREFDGLRMRVRNELGHIEQALTEAVTVAPARRIREV